MARTTWRGVTIDARTALMLAEADRIVGPDVPVRPTQGCYNAGRVSASAGTHDGGGAVDLSARDLTPAQVTAVVRALRVVGFAAWLRTADEGPWSAHIHAIAVGCPDLAPSAARQVTSLRAGRNGLRSNGRDRHAGLGLPVTTWERYRAAKAAAAAPKPAPAPAPAPSHARRHAPGSRTLRVGLRGDDVKTLQRFLGLPVGRTGLFGIKTRAKVRAYQKMRGLYVDGIVGRQTWAPILRALKGQA